MKVTYWAALLGAATFLAGCATQAEQAASQPVANASQAQIDSIQNNKNMPDDVKQAQIARLKGQQKMIDAMDKNSHK